MDAVHALEAISDATDEAIVCVGLDGAVQRWNRSAERIFGYTADEMLGRRFDTLVPEEARAVFHGEFERLMAGSRVEHSEQLRVRKDGLQITVLAGGSTIRDDEGRVIGVVQMAHERTGRRKTDESHFRLAAIVDSADDAIISKDLSGIVRTWNGSAENLFGYTAEEMIGQPILKLIPDELQYEEDEILRRLRAGERIDHYETVRRRKSGEEFQVSVTISPIRDDMGRVIGASKIARDISDRKRLERLVIQSEKLAATGRMAAAIAHEINNPLESLMNLIYLARKNSDITNKAYTYLITAEEELERVSHIARQTLGFYKDTGAPTEARLHDLIDTVLHVYNSKLITANVQVQTHYADVRTISVSKGEMIQVFSNLVANSADAMREGGRLEIVTRNLLAGDSRQEGIEIVIQDTGSGIAPEHLPRVFEPFFTTKGNMGTGVGLWVAKQLIERRGGQISIASSTAKEKSGTMIRIFLPMALPSDRKTADSGLVRRMA